MNIAFVSLQEDKDRTPPLGLVYVATYLNKHLDGVQNKLFDATFSSPSQIIENIIAFKPDLIGLSSMTVNYKDNINFANKLREKLDVPIVIGGVHISTLPGSLDNAFDIGVVGEGEETFLELVKLFLKKGKLITNDLNKINGIVFFDNNKLIKTEERHLIEKLDELPIPDLNYLDKRYFLPTEDVANGKIVIIGYIFTARGCPYRCVFCSTSRFWKKLRLHSAEYIARCVKYQIESFGVNHIHVADDLFAISKERLKEFINVFEHEGILGKVIFSCSQRTDLVDEEMCELMKKLHIVTLNFGFESGSERILKYLKVGTVTAEMNKNAIILCKEFGINVFGSVMFGVPGEKIEDMKKTIEFMEWCLKQKVDYIWTFVATPYPATPWWDEALKRGEVSNNMDWEKLSLHAAEEPMLLDEDVNIDEFMNIFKSSRAKSRRFRYNLIFNFLSRHPLFSIKIFFKDPIFYINKFVTKVLQY